MNNLKLYGFELSGHSHRASVFLSLLGLKAKIIQVDLASGEHKQADFLAKNSFGQVPVLEDNGQFIADSNAILLYLATTYDPSRQWYPESPQQQAEIQRFLSTAAGPVAFGPARARIKHVFNHELDLVQAHQVSEQILTALNAHLAKRDWLAAKHATIADVANYSYIAHAPEGGIDLNLYPNVQAWLNRFEQLPGFVAMPKTYVALQTKL
ncbi:glutathione S-transferase domain-containing protein [Catenovulum agarivorans DS-2]|uniref:Glutathione S-transferase domain-containing protein n=1 Tax=Catenovulum agarivorans DS-2 TaxID=1328313 RepID=W7QFI5_9ALTE|nr:glutathione S-transferase [Catenovulum agarivorans]EWH11669.1 glutathione S-transferase domain-containing protein [Catenovulum agarivorans DS-2]